MLNMYVHEIIYNEQETNIRLAKDLKEGCTYKVRAHIKETGITLSNKYKLNSAVIETGIVCDKVSIMQFKTVNNLNCNFKIIEFIGTLYIKEVEVSNGKLVLYTFISNDSDTMYHLNGLDEKELREILL